MTPACIMAGFIEALVAALAGAGLDVVARGYELDHICYRCSSVAQSLLLPICTVFPLLCVCVWTCARVCLCLLVRVCLLHHLYWTEQVSRLECCIAFDAVRWLPDYEFRVSAGRYTARQQRNGRVTR
eukprot:COSAG03_NODE_7286_length_939_cov_0.891667_1_plen_127_part_00